MALRTTEVSRNGDTDEAQFGGGTLAEPSGRGSASPSDSLFSGDIGKSKRKNKNKKKGNSPEHLLFTSDVGDSKTESSGISTSEGL
jgi:hypothetical protein